MEEGGLRYVMFVSRATEKYMRAGFDVFPQPLTSSPSLPSLPSLSRLRPVKARLEDLNLPPDPLHLNPQHLLCLLRPLPLPPEPAVVVHGGSEAGLHLRLEKPEVVEREAELTLDAEQAPGV